jgi:hypothetical protein
MPTGAEGADAVTPTAERNWGVTGGSLIILTVVMAAFEMVKGVSAIPVCLTCGGATVCAIAAGRLAGAKQQRLAKVASSSSS